MIGGLEHRTRLAVNIHLHDEDRLVRTDDVFIATIGDKLIV